MSYAAYGNTLAEFVKKFREEGGLTQVDLAEAIGVHAQYISNIERGEHPRPVTFAALLLPHVEEKRKKYLIDMMQEMAANRMIVKKEGASGKRRTAKGKGRTVITRRKNERTVHR